MAADDPNNKISLKVFHNEIINDHEAIKREEENYQPLPKIRMPSEEEIMMNYNKVKSDIKELVKDELAKRMPPQPTVKPPKQAQSMRKQKSKPQKRSLSL